MTPLPPIPHHLSPLPLPYPSRKHTSLFPPPQYTMAKPRSKRYVEDGATRVHKSSPIQKETIIITCF